MAPNWDEINGDKDQMFELLFLCMYCCAAL